jgi:hypothetical protein
MERGCSSRRIDAFEILARSPGSPSVTLVGTQTWPERLVVEKLAHALFSTAFGIVGN